MSDSGYTPSTEDVENGYAHDPEAEYRDPVNYGYAVAGNRRAFRRWLSAHEAVIREDERKQQAEKDAVMLENMTCILHNESESRGFYLSLDAAVRNIRGQSFTGTESETNV